MSDRPVNLNRYRKAKAKAAKTARADANATKFGRTKAERRRDEAEGDRAATRLDQHRRDET